MVYFQSGLGGSSLRNPSGTNPLPRGPGEEEALNQHQNILAQLIGAHGEAGNSFLRNYRENPGDLRKNFDSLSSNHQDRLRENLGERTFQEIFSLADESDGQIFASDFLHLGQNLERRNRFPSASLVYQLAASSPSLEGDQSKANQRLRVLQGSGNLGEHLEFLSGQFVDQVTEPSLFLGMLAAGWAFRNVSAGALQLLGRRTLANRAFAWSVGFGAEVPSFALTVRGVQEFQGRPQDWSRQALREDLLRTGLTLLFLKSSAGLGHHAIGSLARGNSILTPFTRFSTLAIPQVTMYTGLLASHATEQYLGLRQPGAHPLLDSLVTLLHFNVAGKILTGFAPQMPASPLQGETLLVRLARQWTESEGIFGAKNQLVTPEGVRIDSHILQMSGEGRGSGDSSAPKINSEAPSRQPSSSGVQATLEVDPSLAPLNFNENLFEGIVNRFHQAGSGFYSLLEVNEGNPLWLQPSRTYALQIRSIVDLTRNSLADHPLRQHYEPVLDQIIQELDLVNGLLHSTPRHIPSPRNNTLAKVFFSEMWRNPNAMVSFLFNGNTMGLNGALKATVLARNSLSQLLNREALPLPQTQTDALMATRTLFDPETGQFAELVPIYEYSEGALSNFKNIPSNGNQVLAIGEVGLLRGSVLEQQNTTRIPSKLLQRHGPEKALDIIQTMAEKNQSTPDQGPGFDYLEIYHLDPVLGHPGTGGDILLRNIISALRPGGVGYLVHRDPSTFQRSMEFLTQAQLADIIEGSIGSSPPVRSYDYPTTNSNYLFFRKLPFR